MLVTGKKALYPVTFLPIQLSTLSLQQKDVLAILKLQVAKMNFWNSYFSQDGGGWTVPVHLRDMAELPQQHPEIYRKFKAGHFIAQKTIKTIESILSSTS